MKLFTNSFAVVLPPSVKTDIRSVYKFGRLGGPHYSPAVLQSIICCISYRCFVASLTAKLVRETGSRAMVDVRSQRRFFMSTSRRRFIAEFKTRRPGWMDSVIDERLWCSLKYECPYLREMETGSELRRILV